MGTNYYMMRKEFKNILDNIPEHEKEYYENSLLIKIGKASYGWKFLFHYSQFFKSYKELLELLNKFNFVIIDEYNKIISIEEFKHIVESRQLCNSHKQIDSDIIEIDGYDFCKGVFY